MNERPGSSTFDTRLHGSRLWVARMAWGIIALTTILLFISSQFITRGQVDQPQLQQVPIPQNAAIVYDASTTVLNWAFAAVYLAVGLVIFWRKSSDWMALFTSLMLVTFGLATFSNSVAAIEGPIPWLRLPVTIVTVIGQLSIAYFFYLFPDGKFVPRISIMLAAIWTAVQVLSYALPGSKLDISTLPSLVNDGIWAFFLCSFFGAQIVRYFHTSSQVQRQQTKRVVFGVLIALVGFMTCILTVTVLAPSSRTWIAYTLFNAGIYLFMMLIPISIGMAIMKSHLWDIDIVIRRTLIYGLLIVLLAIVYLGSVFLLQQIFQKVFLSAALQASSANGASRSGIEVVISTLIIIMIFNPLRKRVQQVIDRRFFRQNYDAARMVEEFSRGITGEVDAEQMAQRMLGVVEHTLHPDNLSIWLKDRS